MQNALLIGVSRQVALGRELDVIANNVANITTNGFKGREARFQEYLMPTASAENFPRGDRRLSYVIDGGTPLNTASGPIEHTGNPLDVAIRGEAFFAVQTPAGERYTRNGAFAIDGRGQLATSDGHAVLGENGPITFSPQESNVQVAPDGTVTTSAGQRGKLRLVQFADLRALRNEGANVFSSPTPGQPAGSAGRVEPGAIERSNVRPVVEMSRLIDVNRTYAMVSTMVQQLDGLRRTAISRLADVGSA